MRDQQAKFAPKITETLVLWLGGAIHDNGSAVKLASVVFNTAFGNLKRHDDLAGFYQSQFVNSVESELSMILF